MPLIPYYNVKPIFLMIISMAFLVSVVFYVAFRHDWHPKQVEPDAVDFYLPHEYLVKTSHPVVKASHPVVKSSHPVVKSSHPVVKSSHPVVKSSHPVVKTSHPVVKIISHPVVKASHPVVKASHPVVKSSHPVVKTSHPVVKTSHPPNTGIHEIESNATRSKENLALLKAYHEQTSNLRRKFDCEKLFQKDPKEQSKVRDFFSRHRSLGRFPVLDSTIATKILQNCKSFKEIRNFHEDAGSAEEQAFPVAYVITVHRDFEHLERLVRALYRPHNVYCIHVDRKASDNLKQAIGSLASCFPNVLMASHQFTIIYAHVSRLLADITCMRDILSSGRPWRYVINMAATEFPMKTNRETVDILQSLHGLNDIHESFAKKVHHRWKVEHRVIKGDLKETNKLLAPPPHNITVTKGQAYNTYSRAFVEWFLSDKRVFDFLNWSKLTYSPDEHFWGSLNNLYHNSFLKTPGGFYGDPDMKGYITKFISWQGTAAPRFHCYGKIIHNICVFSYEDLPIIPQEKHLAANKFDLTLDPVAYSCMEEMLEKKTKARVPIDLQLYKRLYFVRFKPPKEK